MNLGTLSPDSQKLLWHRITGDIFFGIDSDSGGLIGFQAEGQPTVFGSSSQVILKLGGREKIQWVDVPGNNLIGDRSSVVVGAKEISLSAVPQGVSKIDQGIEVVRQALGYKVVETWRWLRGATISRTVSLSWVSLSEIGPIREVTLLAPGVTNDQRAQKRLIGMAAGPGWKIGNLTGSFSEQLLLLEGPAATVPLMADVGSAVVGVRREEIEAISGLASLDFPALAEFREVEGSISSGHRIRSAASESSRSESLKIGTQVICLNGFVEDLGFGIRTELMELSNSPEWLRAATIYEVHIGNKFPDPFAPNQSDGKNPYPDVDALISDLPRIRKLGFDVIQLMPLFPFPGYTIVNYFDSASQYGGAQQVQKLSEAVSNNGQRLIVDFILHGVVDKSIKAYQQWAPKRSRYLDEHPDWFMQNESGEMRRTHTYSFDLANPALQQHMIDAMLQLLRLGVSGFRVDAPLWNLFPNFSHEIGYPAGHSTMGWVEIMFSLREQAAAAGLEVALIGETAGIGGASVFDGFYGYEEMGLYRGFVQPGKPFLALSLDSKEVLDASQLRSWLVEKSLLSGLDGFSRTIRQLDSHDSYEWGSLSTVASSLFGPAFEAVLMSIALLPGPWMHFCGAEQGVEDQIMRVGEYRRHAAVRAGSIDFAASSCLDSEIFHFVSTWSKEAQLVIANFSDRTQVTKLTLEATVAQKLHRVISEDPSATMRQNDCRITIEAWGYRVFQTQPRDEGVVD